MMFDPNSGATARKLKLIWAASIVFWLAWVGGIAWVAVHFISKYW